MKQIKCIVGLGNPGEQYVQTRHNAGWLVLDQLCAAVWCTDFIYQKKFDAQLANGMIDGWQIIAVKPQTYMNRSGKTVQALLSYYEISLDDLLVIHDDIDLAPGRTKLKYGGSAGWHNGIRDIHLQIGTDQIRRLKLGIGRPDTPKYAITDYVLGRFSQEELALRVEKEWEIRNKISLYFKNTG
jgi:PTH1 family peptidyl-tRNA hydrolase